jgi:hypothetical protein
MSTAQTEIDRQHLKVLAILHYVLGGLEIFAGFFALIYVGVGIFMFYVPTLAAQQPQRPNQPGPPPEALFSIIGWVYILLGGVMSLWFWTIGGLAIAGGRCLTSYRRWTFCIVVAAISCLFMPLGTILGIFTIVILMRPTVKERFEVQARGGLLPLPE